MNVVLLFEGTDNDPDTNPSAISRLKGMLVDDVARGQVVRVMSGSGTHGYCWWRKVCLVTGWDSGWIVRNQLRWLTNFMVDENLCWSDINLYVFGFSRGGYQARLLANKIDRINRSHQSFPQVRYLGLIDAVCGVCGLRASFHSLVPPKTICRHAVAIHEYRRRFSPMLINESKMHDNVTERFFLGSHSDVGWAYNGNRHERIFPLGHWFPCCSYHVNHGRSKFCGMVSLSWVINPVINELNFIPSLSRDQKAVVFHEQTIPAVSDYVNLIWTFYLIFHDSLVERSNVLSKPRARRVRIDPSAYLEKLHYSAASIAVILDSGILGKQLAFLAAPRSRGRCLFICDDYEVGERVDVVSLLRGTFLFEKFDPRLRGLTLRHRHGIKLACLAHITQIENTLRSMGCPIV